MTAMPRLPADVAIQTEGTMRVLVVDDEQDIRFTSQVLREHLGYEVRTAKDGRLGLEYVDEWAPHAVLMDLSMPTLDGFLATRKLRQTDNGRNILVIVCSAHAQDELTAQLALAAGCDACCTKPVDWTRVHKLLADFELTGRRDES